MDTMTTTPTPIFTNTGGTTTATTTTTGSMLAWQACYVVSMFFGTFLSYLVPIVLIQRQQRRQQQMALALGTSDQTVPPGAIPTYSDTNRRTQRILSACNCLSAGIFMGICFLNLIPYVDDEFRDLFADWRVTVTFPIGMFTVILGLFLVLVLETLVMACRGGGGDNPVLLLDDEEDISIDEQTQELLGPHNSRKGSTHGEYPEIVLTANNKHHNHRNNHHNNTHHNHNHSYDDNAHSHHHHGHSHDYSHVTGAGSVSFFILMFATSVHSVFEGLALGLQRDPTKALHLFIGIILHECLVALALGLNAARLDPGLKTNLRFSAVFSLTIPVGIVAGVALGVTPGLFGRSISALFQGLAAGTFIHVTFHELIPAEFMGSHGEGGAGNGAGTFREKLFKILLLFIGFCIMAVMTLITSDSH